jgi:hypothetical protein
VDAKGQLDRLLRIQDLAIEILAARRVVEAAPAKIEAIEARFRERNAEYVALRDRHAELERDTRDRNGELDTLGETLRHFMDGLMQVKNQREYSAVLKEIDTVRAQKAGHEEAVLKNMEEIETLAAELASRAAHIAEERTQVESERAEVEAEAEAARARVAAGEADRARNEAELPRDLVDAVRRVEELRQGVFLARADKEMCQACFVRVRPQVFQEIRQCARIHSCANCRRYLYFEPALRSRPASAVGADPAGIEASNGSAV